MKRLLSAISAAVILASATAVPSHAQETPLINGKFYTQGSSQPGLGYAVVDDGGGAFFSTYAALGGPDVLGFPVSRRFASTGGAVQVFQQHVLQATAAGVVLYPTLDVLSAAGLDGWLSATYQIPPAEDLTGVNPLAVLEESPAIAAAYYAIGEGYNGLPTARMITFADVRTLRAQRVAIYERVSGVSYAPIGEIAAASGIFPAVAFQPQTIQQASGGISAPPPAPAPAGGSSTTIPTETLGVSAVAATIAPAPGSQVRVAIRVTDSTGRPLAGAVVLAIVHYPLKAESEAWAVDGVFFGQPSDDRGNSVITVTIDPNVPAGLAIQVEVSATYPPGGGQTFVDMVVG